MNKNEQAARKLSVIVASFACFTCVAGSAVLSVEESIKCLQSSPVHGQESANFRKLLWRINPEAKPIFWKTLEEDENKKYWSMAAKFIGYVGNEDDVELIEKFILRISLVKELDTHKRRAIRSMIQSLGVLKARGFNRAGEVLERMLQVSYWKDVKFDWVDVRTENYPATSSFLSCQALRALVFSDSYDDEELTEFVKVILSSMSSRESKLVIDYGWADFSKMTHRIDWAAKQ